MFICLCWYVYENVYVFVFVFVFVYVYVVCWCVCVCVCVCCRWPVKMWMRRWWPRWQTLEHAWRQRRSWDESWTIRSGSPPRSWPVSNTLRRSVLLPFVVSISITTQTVGLCLFFFFFFFFFSKTIIPYLSILYSSLSHIHTQHFAHSTHNTHHRTFALSGLVHTYTLYTIHYTLYTIHYALYTTQSQADIYSFGMILFEVLTRRLPFDEFEYRFISKLEKQVFCCNSNITCIHACEYIFVYIYVCVDCDRV